MHTFNTKTAWFLHNGDFSGEVKIVNKSNGQETEVPFTDIKKFVAESMRRKKIAYVEQQFPYDRELVAYIENMSDDEILSVK